MFMTWVYCKLLTAFTSCLTKDNERVVRHCNILFTYVFPLVKVGQVDLAVGVYVFASLDHHSTGGLDKANGRVVGIRVQEPKTHWDVVDIACQKETVQHISSKKHR